MGFVLVFAGQGATYRDFEDELLAIVVGLEGVENSRQLSSVEFNYEASAMKVFVPLLALYSLGKSF
jgi:hypothetical protein